MHGVALSALRNSAHLGRLGDWAEMAAAAGMASLHFVNATGIPLRVVPHGGRDGRGTTNPLAIGIPVMDGAPVVLDFATSAIAEGKVRLARNKGVEVPPDCLLDADGRPTTDPNQLYTDPPGTLLPFGGGVSGHKGGALWLMVDLFAGAFTGGGCSACQGGRASQQHALDRDRARGLPGTASRRIRATWSSSRAQGRAQRAARSCCRASPSGAPRPSVWRTAFRSTRRPGRTSWRRARASGSSGQRWSACLGKRRQPLDDSKDPRHDPAAAISW